VRFSRGAILIEVASALAAGNTKMIVATPEVKFSKESD
jgi:hypothetical protein